jgi:hypothetical protein
VRVLHQPIEKDEPRAAILMFMPEEPNTHYQVDAHIQCLRGLVDPAMAEQIDPAFWEARTKEFKSRRKQSERHVIDE